MNLSFESMVREQQASVRGLFLNLTLGDEMLSDDLAQETFIKAYKGWNAFRMVSSTKTWLFRIAYNVFFDYNRSRREKKLFDVSKANSLTSNDTNISVKIDIFNAMQLLSEQERVCITLALVEGYSMKEISGITTLPENTIKSHIFRGREKITTYLREHGYENKK